MTSLSLSHQCVARLTEVKTSFSRFPPTKGSEANRVIITCTNHFAPKVKSLHSVYFHQDFLSYLFNLFSLSSGFGQAMIPVRAVVCSGPSGSGKSTVINRLFDRFPGCFAFSVSRKFVGKICAKLSNDFNGPFQIQLESPDRVSKMAKIIILLHVNKC